MSQRSKQEAELALAQLAAIVEYSEDAIISQDLNGIITSWNRAAERLYGYTAAEAVGQSVSILIPPGRLNEEPQILERIQRGEVFLHYETVRRHKDGTLIDISNTVSPIKDARGRIVGASKIARDIRARKKSEQQALIFTDELERRVAERTAELEALNRNLQQEIEERQAIEDRLRMSEERFLNAFEYAAIGMAIVALDGHWLKVNAALSRLLGYSAEELADKTFQDITHPEDLGVDLGYVDRLLAGEIHSYNMEKRYFHKRGHVIWAMLSVSLVRDGHYQPVYFVSQIEDITEAKQAMARQQELTQKALAAEKAKSDFLAIMSHEIRTPMNGVIGMTSLLADTPLTESQRDYVNTILSSGEALLVVINDILDFSKIESGKLKVENRPFHLAHGVEEALALFAAQLQMKHLEAVYLVSSEVPTHVVGDGMRLRQILVNLLSNAIKFTSEGEISLNVRCQKNDEEGCLLEFSVTDTGVGIPKEAMGKLFQSFQQVDTSTTRRYGGTGLGLAISKSLAELMGGTMWAESEPGVGSTFFFTCLMQPEEIQYTTQRLPMPALLKGRTALIVNAHVTTRRILETQLQVWAMKTEAVPTGIEALTKVRQEKFDVILLDAQMLETDGFGLAREIRQRVAAPLILLSSAGKVLPPEDAALFHAQVPKPIKHSSLFDALTHVTGVAAIPAPVSPTRRFDPDMAKKHPLRILLAEDNAVNQKVGSRMLAQLGYRNDLAANGIEVLAAIEKSSYDLIFMDIQMPEMDGLEAADRVRKQLGARCPFIVALTAEALQGDRERFLSLGFDGYLSKPLQAQALQHLLLTVRPLPPQT